MEETTGAAAAAAALPDLKVCRARHIGAGDLYDCLAAEPMRCPHSLQFGCRHYCRHPQREVIAEFTDRRWRGW